MPANIIKTKKEGKGYRVFCDGRKTDLMIYKGDVPSWGERQEWIVLWDNGKLDYPNDLFATYSKSEAVSAISKVLQSVMPND